MKNHHGWTGWFRRLWTVWTVFFNWSFANLQSNWVAFSFFFSSLSGFLKQPRQKEQVQQEGNSPLQTTVQLPRVFFPMLNHHFFCKKSLQLCVYFSVKKETSSFFLWPKHFGPEVLRSNHPLYRNKTSFSELNWLKVKLTTWVKTGWFNQSGCCTFRSPWCPPFWHRVCRHWSPPFSKGRMTMTWAKAAAYAEATAFQDISLTSWKLAFFIRFHIFPKSKDIFW